MEDKKGNIILKSGLDAFLFDVFGGQEEPAVSRLDRLASTQTLLVSETTLELLAHLFLVLDDAVRLEIDGQIVEALEREQPNLHALFVAAHAE